MKKQNRIVVLGAGESGTGAALLANQLGYAVFVSDKSPIKPAFKAELEAAGIDYEEGQHSFDKILVAREVVKSPGIPEKTELMQAVRKAGIPVIGEIEFAWRHRVKSDPIVAITGSNGKTTTTALTYHLLRAAGLPAEIGGNIGKSYARLMLDDLNAGRAGVKTLLAPKVFVLEISSFQLEDIAGFRPQIALLLNITPDHLDRYDYQMEKYAQAKFNINRNQKRGDCLIYNGDDPVTLDYLQGHALAPAKTIAVKNRHYQNGILRIGRKYRFDLSQSRLRGPHNQFNARCAVQAALLLGATPEAIQAGLNSFLPPAHRMELIATVQGVTYINDSKATNVDAVFYALQAMEQPTVWIVGGTDKGNDYQPLLPLARKKVKAIVCMGLDNSPILKAFRSTGLPIHETRSAREAVQTAAGLAQPGDTVLLSPACASFDLFKNYEDRGEQFRQAVLELQSSKKIPLTTTSN